MKIGFWGTTPVVQPSGADRAVVTLGNADGEIGELTISDPPTQADNVRVPTGLLHALRGRFSAWVAVMWGT